MTPENRRQKIESYGNALRNWWRPSSSSPKICGSSATSTAAGGIHEHIIHITDSEANSYIRARRLIPEPAAR